MAIYFTGVANENLSTGVGTTETFSNGFSASAWGIYDSAAVATNHFPGLVSSNQSTGDNRSWALYANQLERPGFSVSSDGTSANQVAITGSTGLTMNVWRHYGGTFSPSTFIRVYESGAQAGENTTSIPASVYNNGLDIKTHAGYDFANSFAVWDGSVCEVGVWNTTLTGGEMAALGAGYSPLFIRPSNLIVYVPGIRETVNVVDSTSITVNGTMSVTNHPDIIYPTSPFNMNMPFPPPLVASGGTIIPHFYHHRHHNLAG